MVNVRYHESEYEFSVPDKSMLTYEGLRPIL